MDTQLSKELEKDYDRILSEHSSALLSGVLCPEIEVLPGSTRWGLSLVVRMDKQLFSAVAEAQEEMSQLLGRGHYYYDSDAIHTTIRSIEGRRETGHFDHELLTEYSKRVHTVLQHYEPFDIEYRGLTASNSGVFIQGWPLESTLATIRKDLHRELAQIASPAGPEVTNPRKTAHATAVLFRESIHHPQEFHKFILDNRSRAFGTTRVKEMHLVLYQLGQRVQLTTVRSFELISK